MQNLCMGQAQHTSIWLLCFGGQVKTNRKGEERTGGEFVEISALLLDEVGELGHVDTAQKGSSTRYCIRKYLFNNRNPAEERNDNKCSADSSSADCMNGPVAWSSRTLTAWRSECTQGGESRSSARPRRTGTRAPHVR